MQVLIVEDEVRLAEALGQILSEQKYLVDIVHDGEDGYDYAASGIYDVIVLDVMLPGMDGYEIVRKLRRNKNQTPVIMLTARSATDDKVKGLDCGADDYMTKPFEPEELLARIRALTRRQGEVVLDEMTFGDLTLDLSTCDLKCAGKSIHLNFKEFEILKLLMGAQGSVITKEDIIVKVWGYDSDASDNNVEAYISFLRKKFAFLKTKASIIALRKVGYRLMEEQDQR
ncbi:MAG: response regulator transcription factor [Eubacteriales bacterium]|nr:response regulator transcription factor [Eubacteriales bacterium]